MGKNALLNANDIYFFHQLLLFVIALSVSDCLENHVEKNFIIEKVTAKRLDQRDPIQENVLEYKKNDPMKN